MKMTISRTYPPNINEIRQTFGAAAIRNAVFTYGSTVYMPGMPQGAVPVSHLIAHEEIHILQQADDPAGWWDRYLVDPEFRLQQELAAYRAQYEFIATHHDRKMRRKMLRSLAKDLSGAMYANLMTPAEAEAAIAAKD